MSRWTPVPGYEGRYEVSVAGEVRSLSSGRLRKSRLDAYGYRIIDLWDGRRYRTWKVHRLVLLAFVGPAPEMNWEGHHINGVRADNRLSNLRWASVPENRTLVFKPRGRDGVVGVRYRPERQRWQAYMRVGGHFRSLGHHKTKAAAVRARKLEEMRLYG